MILALDFDGVLHPVKTTTEPKFVRLGLFEQWLRANPDIDVVISSSWREVHPFELLQSFFDETLQHRIVGATPVRVGAAGPGVRQSEIEDWIAASSDPSQAWVALDDDASQFAEGQEGVVICDPVHGLTDTALEALSRAIAAKRPTP